jgi:hypothetical protein
MREPRGSILTVMVKGDGNGGISRDDGGVFRDEVRPLMVDEHSSARAGGASSMRRRED